MCAFRNVPKNVSSSATDESIVNKENMRREWNFDIFTRVGGCLSVTSSGPEVAFSFLMKKKERSLRDASESDRRLLVNSTRLPRDEGDLSGAEPNANSKKSFLRRTEP